VGGGFGCGFVEFSDNHMRTFAGQPFCNTAPDALPGPGDDRNFACVSVWNGFTWHKNLLNQRNLLLSSKINYNLFLSSSKQKEREFSFMKVDSHQHFWNLSEVEYSWLAPAHGPIYGTFGPAELEPHIKAAGIDRTVMVQSANSYEDTASMLVHSDHLAWIGAVIGWVNLLNPAETEQRLQMYQQHPKFRGIRHLIHDEKDPDWVVQPVVIESLKILAAHAMIFEVVAVFPNHLKHVPTLAAAIPNLTLVIDHLAKPPIAAKAMSPWSDQLKAAAAFPHVYAKVSGLNTAASPHWDAAELKPYIDFAIDCFGADRLMFGGDWPVAILAGDYAQVWRATQAALAGRPQAEIDAILGGTAQRVYRIS
jgi:L-fuconolactonase